MFNDLTGFKSFKELNDFYKSCPKHDISEMSFKEIQSIAAMGKATEYGIKMGDIIKINDEINAEIIFIGDDYIEFMTVQKILDSPLPETLSKLKWGHKVISHGLTAYYQYPQVNCKGKNKSAQISYVNSSLKENVEAWLEKQSNEFKSVLKPVKRNYKIATLSCRRGKYNQIITGVIEDIEKIYVPTKYELEKIYSFSSTHDTDCFWTSTPCKFSKSNWHDAFGCFYWYNGNEYQCTPGSDCGGTIALFRIG